MLKYTVFFVAMYALFALHSSSTGRIASNTEPAREKPNIVLIVADDLGWNDVGYHGSDVLTPNLDAIVRQAAEFDRFYAYHGCTPTRAGLMTGRYPERLGLSHILYPTRKGGLSPDEQTLAELLADEGYEHRACIGKWHLGHSDIKYHPLNQGFTFFYGCYGGLVDYFLHVNKGQLDWHRNFEPSYDKGYTTDLITQEAMAFIDEKADEESPFFLYVPYNAPHGPLQAPHRYLSMYDFDVRKPIFSDSTVYPDAPKKRVHRGQGNSKRQTYAAMVTAMDDGIGQIFDKLKESGELENTFFLFMSDNGGSIKFGGSNLPLRGEKGTCFEGGLRVPAFLYYPKLAQGGTVIDQVTGYIDIMATIRDLLDVKAMPANELDGISFLPALKGHSKRHAERMIFTGKHSVVREDWKVLGKNLFQVGSDTTEARNIAESEAALFESLADTLATFSAAIKAPVNIDDGHKVPLEWKIPE